MGGSQSLMNPPGGAGSSNTSSSGQRSAGADGRIVVDIRGANLEHNYSIWVKKQPQRELQQGVATALQSMGGALITLLTIQKLWEEVRFVRSLRGDLSRLASSMATPDAEQAASRSSVMPRGGKAGGKLLPPTSAGAATADGGDVAGSAPTWDKIAGLKQVKMLLQEATVLPVLRPDMFQGIRQPPRGLLLFGPPGSGKTMLARAVALESRATFLPITGGSILSMWYGQSEANVKALFEKARQQQPAVIFIDEVDSLLGKRSERSSDSMPDRRVTNEFLAYIDGIQMAHDNSRIILIAATNNPWDLDEAALSRFARRIYVPLPDKHTRATLIAKTMQGVSMELSEAELLQLGERTAKYSGRDLVQVCREASMRPLRELWGERLLESGGPHNLAQQQLVEVVADGMGRGNGERRVRKELERWKRKHHAEWCDPDTVLAQAGKFRAARARSSSGQLQQQQQQNQNRQQRQDAEPPEPSGAGRAGADGGDEGVASHCLDLGLDDASSGDECGLEGNSDDQGAEEEGRAAAITEEAASTSGGGGSSAGCRAAAADAAGASGSGLANPGKAAASSDSGSSRDGAPRRRQRRVQQLEQQQQPVGPVSSSDSWTVDELLSLSADVLRPVRLPDFEAALSIMSHTEFELTGRYEEWDAKYGAGASARRTAGPERWAQMYV